MHPQCERDFPFHVFLQLALDASVIASGAAAMFITAYYIVLYDKIGVLCVSNVSTAWIVYLVISCTTTVYSTLFWQFLRLRHAIRLADTPEFETSGGGEPPLVARAPGGDPPSGECGHKRPPSPPPKYETLV